MSTLFSDDFNRSDGSPGSPWVEQSGTWAIASNQLRTTVAAGNITVDVGVSDYDVSVTDVVFDLNGRGPIIRYTDESNNIRLLGDNTQLLLVKREAGSNSTLLTGLGALTSGDVMRITNRGNDIDVYLNGVLKGSTSSSFNTSATKVGIRSQGTSQRFDDFIVSNVAGNIKTMDGLAWSSVKTVD